MRLNKKDMLMSFKCKQDRVDAGKDRFGIFFRLPRAGLRAQGRGLWPHLAKVVDCSSFQLSCAVLICTQSVLSQTHLRIKGGASENVPRVARGLGGLRGHKSGPVTQCVTPRGTRMRRQSNFCDELELI